MNLQGIAGRVATIVLVLLSVLMGVIGVSVWFATEDPWDRAANVLVSTFAAGMAILGIAIIVTGFRRREWWAWLVLWYYPIFFVIHALTLGTLIPDGVFAALSVAALLLARPALPTRTAARVASQPAGWGPAAPRR